MKFHAFALLGLIAAARRDGVFQGDKDNPCRVEEFYTLEDLKYERIVGGNSSQCPDTLFNHFIRTEQANGEALSFAINMQYEQMLRHDCRIEVDEYWIDEKGKEQRLWKGLMNPCDEALTSNRTGLIVHAYCRKYDNEMNAWLGSIGIASKVRPCIHDEFPEEDVVPPFLRDRSCPFPFVTIKNGSSVVIERASLSKHCGVLIAAKDPSLFLRLDSINDTASKTDRHLRLVGLDAGDKYELPQFVVDEGLIYHIESDGRIKAYNRRLVEVFPVHWMMIHAFPSTLQSSLVNVQFSAVPNTCKCMEDELKFTNASEEKMYFSPGHHDKKLRCHITECSFNVSMAKELEDNYRIEIGQSFAYGEVTIYDENCNSFLTDLAYPLYSPRSYLKVKLHPGESGYPDYNITLRLVEKKPECECPSLDGTQLELVFPAHCGPIDCLWSLPMHSRTEFYEVNTTVTDESSWWLYIMDNRSPLEPVKIIGTEKTHPVPADKLKGNMTIWYHRKAEHGSDFNATIRIHTTELDGSPEAEAQKRSRDTMIAWGIGVVVAAAAVLFLSGYLRRSYHRKAMAVRYSGAHNGFDNYAADNVHIFLDEMER